MNKICSMIMILVLLVNSGVCLASEQDTWKDPYYYYGQESIKRFKDKGIISETSKKWSNDNSLISRRDAVSLVYIAKNLYEPLKGQPKMLIWQTIESADKQRKNLEEYSVEVIKSQQVILEDFVSYTNCESSYGVTYDYKDVDYGTFDNMLLMSFVGAELMIGTVKEDGLYADLDSNITNLEALVLMNRMLVSKSYYNFKKPEILGTASRYNPFSFSAEEWYTRSENLGIINCTNPYWNGGIKMNLSTLDDYIGGNTFMYLLYLTMNIPITHKGMEKNFKVMTTWDMIDMYPFYDGSPYVGIEI